MNKQIGFVFAIIVLAAATVGLLSPAPSIGDVPGNNTGGILLIDKLLDRHINQEDNLKRFSSYNELVSFLKTNREKLSYSGGFKTQAFATTAATSAFAESSFTAAARSDDYSATNIQVEGVDEADIVKNDGKYIYTVVGDKLFIVDAYPAEEARAVSETMLRGNPTEIFVSNDRLVVLGQDYSYDGSENGGGVQEKVAVANGVVSIASPIIVRPASMKTLMTVYDISDREKPVLVRSLTVSGNYYDSRMIGEYVYAVANQPVNYYGSQPVPLPIVSEGNAAAKEVKEVPAADIYYFDSPDYNYNYINIISINTQNDAEDYNSKTFLSGSAQNMFVSLGNIYVTYTKRNDFYTKLDRIDDVYEGKLAKEKEKTVVHKIAISDGVIEYKGQGTVPGHVLNQFSMDEHNGYFRIATTTGQVSRFEGGTKSQNHIYVLDESLKAVGAVEDLAPGEKIYSVRFIGNRAYMVTFKKVDPLFVIDLSEPTQPKVLGKLKIPGYSDYLHPYDENHIIGLGKEAAEAESGDFAWYQGIKLALFDVSDPENPREVSKYNIGDRGTDSYALQDHKAFLFSRQKNLLVIPILLAEIDESRYAEGSIRANTYGKYVWQGAYVFSLDTESGFELKGRVTHLDGEEGEQQLLKSGYYFNSEYSVKRSLFMDNVLYTLSDRMVKMNDLDDLDEVNRVNLQGLVKCDGCGNRVFESR